MVRHIKRWFAIRSYVTRLSGELARRFGVQRFYTVEQVSQTVDRSRMTAVFIAYAHAIFCSRHDFDANYRVLRVACTYDGLRAVVARRYFDRSIDFDAASVIKAFRRPRYGEPTNFYESGLGD